MVRLQHKSLEREKHLLVCLNSTMVRLQQITPDVILKLKLSLNSTMVRLQPRNIVCF